MRSAVRSPARVARIAKRALRFEPLESRQLLIATPLITEFMAANDDGIVDQDGDRSDWLELGNVGDTPINLAGWHLTDNAGDLDKWTLPDLVLDPGEFHVVFASGKNRAVAGSELHTNFSLSAGGEFLALVDTFGVVASQYAPEYPEQRSNISFGMRMNGGVAFPNELRVFSPATPGAANGEGFLGIVEPLSFSVPHGFYTSTQNVDITTPTPGVVIRYTLDGTVPTAFTGTVLSGPLAISHITVLRARAFRTGYLASNVETQTYLFINDVLTQTRPASYPTSWGTAPAFPIFGIPPFPTPADYDIDPEIVNNPAYTADFLAGLTSIPTVSVVMNADDLFGTAGIYSHPWERGDLWERATSIELINPDGTGGFQIDAGLRILGNASRQPALSPKHSLRVEFRSQYGGSQLDYPLFGPDGVSSFDSLVLRANLSDSWVSPQGSEPVLSFVGSQGRPRAQYARDNYARDLQQAMGQLVPQSEYVHVYINGLYWGLHDLIERRDGDFVAEHMGGDPEDYDILQDDVFEDSGLVVEGDTVAWDAMFALANVGLANDAQYQQIQQYLDIDQFIDYMHLHLFVGSQDWPNNNWTAYRERDGGKFAFMIWDAEYTLHDPTLNRINVSDAASPGQLWTALRNNAEFRLKFADRAHHFLFNGGLLTPGPAADRYLALVNQLNTAIVDESARWGDYRRDVHQFYPPFELSTRNDKWLPERTRLINSYFPVRTQNVLNQYIAAGLYPTLVAPEFNQHGGHVSSDFTLTIAAPVGQIYYTLNGSDPRLPGGSIAPGAILYDGTVTISSSTHVNARSKNGSVWSALTAADFTGELPHLRITELMYNPLAPPPGPVDKEEFEYVELQNVGTTTIKLAGMRLSDAVTFTFPDVNLAPGQFIVVAKNLTAFQSRYGNAINAVGPYGGNLNNGGELVTLLDAFEQTIQSFNYLDDDWYPTTDGPGRSLVIRKSDAPLSAWGQVSGWRPSTNLLGSPGAVDPEPGSIGRRQLFYNQSVWDGSTPGIDFVSDAAAIASDKVAYIPGNGPATLANITSYSRGINGLIIDLDGAGNHGAISAADFVFRMSDKSGANANHPESWVAAPTPAAVQVSLGGGVSGSDRVEITWNSGDVINRWLMVQVKANAQTGLEGIFGNIAGNDIGDIFFFGSRVGDGNGSFTTTNVDAGLARSNGGAATVTSLYDYDRSGSVTLTDAGHALNNPGALAKINLGGVAALQQPAGGRGVAPQVREAGIATALAVGAGQAASGKLTVSSAPQASSTKALDPSAVTRVYRDLEEQQATDEPATRAGRAGQTVNELLDELVASLAGK